MPSRGLEILGSNEKGNAQVTGRLTVSSPVPRLLGDSDRWLSGQKQQTVNLPAHAVYGGSNPPLSTELETRKWKFENRKLQVVAAFPVEFRVSIFEFLILGAGVTQW